jgi:hypothetical protein
MTCLSGKADAKEDTVKAVAAKDYALFSEEFKQAKLNFDKLDPVQREKLLKYKATMKSEREGLDKKQRKRFEAALQKDSNRRNKVAKKAKKPDMHNESEKAGPSSGPAKG